MAQRNLLFTVCRLIRLAEKEPDPFIFSAARNVLSMAEVRGADPGRVRRLRFILSALQGEPLAPGVEPYRKGELRAVAYRSKKLGLDTAERLLANLDAAERECALLRRERDTAVASLATMVGVLEALAHRLSPEESATVASEVARGARQ